MGRQIVRSKWRIAHSPISKTRMMQQTLVFAAPKLDGRTKWVQVLKKQAVVVDCAPLFENQRAGWVTQQARELGLQLEAQALEMLNDQANEGLYAAMRELEKLSVYMSEGTTCAGAGRGIGSRKASWDFSI